LTRLKLEVPPGFEEALGCGETGAAYLGFYWEIDTFVCDNGQYEQEVNMAAWRKWAEQTTVAPILTPLFMGPLQYNGTMALLLDTTEYAFYLGWRHRVIRLLGMKNRSLRRDGVI
jgi:hypothetical protein